MPVAAALSFCESVFGLSEIGKTPSETMVRSGPVKHSNRLISLDSCPFFGRAILVRKWATLSAWNPPDRSGFQKLIFRSANADRILADRDLVDEHVQPSASEGRIGVAKPTTDAR